MSVINCKNIQNQLKLKGVQIFVFNYQLPTVYGLNYVHIELQQKPIIFSIYEWLYLRVTGSNKHHFVAYFMKMILTALWRNIENFYTENIYRKNVYEIQPKEKTLFFSSSIKTITVNG